MNNTAIQKVTPPDSASDFAVLKEQCTMLVKTGFLPQAIKTPEQALAIVLTGRELGIGTMAALNTINVIQGKPTVSPQLMLALIERSGQLEDIQIHPHDGNAIRCTMKRRGRSPHTEYFGQAEAAAMQLAGKDNYKKQAATMYKWRAVAACARAVFADVILGLYTPDEMGADVNEEGEILPPAKDNIRELPPPVNEPEPEAAQADPGDRIDYPTQVQTLLKELNKAGDEIKWTPTMIKQYAADLFGLEVLNGLDELTAEQWQFLAEDLTERLDALR